MSDELQHSAFTGASEYIAALDTLCGLAHSTLCVFEKNFAEIGFNSETRIAALRSFLIANPANRLQLLAHDARPMVQRCPRLMLLLRQFSHSMHIYQTPEHLQHLSEPFAVADASHYVRRFHFDDPRGILAQYDVEGSRVLKSRFAEMWASSRPALSATTLGL